MSSTNQLSTAQPIFRVTDMQASIDYYVQKLGFKLDWGMGVFASVSRDRCALYLSQGDQGHLGAWAWVGLEDAGALAEEFAASGAKIRQKPTNFPWAYEMQVEDPDGNILRFGSEPLKDQPYGEWLDMNGQTWPPLGADGPPLCD